MKTLLRTALLVATLASAALVTGALHGGVTRAASPSICVTVPVINPMTGVLSCVDQFGNFVPVATVQTQTQLFPGCMTGPGGVLFCPPGNRISIQPQVVFSRPGQSQQLFLVQPRQFFFSTPFFRRCFLNMFGMLSCF